MKFTSALFMLLMGATAAMGPVPDVTPVDYQDGNFTLQGFLSVPQGLTDQKIPAVIVIPDWDGVNYYEQQRATMISQELGYVGFAADIFGPDKHNVPTVPERIALVSQYHGDKNLYMSRITAAIEEVKAHPNVDENRVGLAGYCFGGTGVIDYALMGLNDVEALVSIHGGLSNQFDGMLQETGPEILILSGGDDDQSSDIMALEETLDFTNATWEITRYSGIQHAWTVFDGSAYDPWADMRTWESMTHFLHYKFGEVTYDSMKPSLITTTPVSYIDPTDNFDLLGHVAMPNPYMWDTPAPAIVLIPDWTNVDTYEKERATLFASMGYVAFAADIYGPEYQPAEGDDRRNQATFYRSDNVDLYISRMKAAVEEVKKMPEVDSENIAMLGYCFGGTGVIYYAVSGQDDVQVVVSLHGGLTYEFDVSPNGIYPYTMVLSGGADDAHGNQTYLEETFNAGSADWEISRWSGVLHGFTDWDRQSRYNLRADARSMRQLLTAINQKMSAPVEKSITMNIPETAVDAGMFTTLVNALQSTNIDLSGDGPFTVFAPSDEAFGDLPEALRSCILKPENSEVLTSLLQYHVVSDVTVFAADLPGVTAPVRTLNGETIVVDLSDGVKINTVNVVAADIPATNGVIHVIDGVLIPPSFDSVSFLASCEEPMGDIPAVASAAGDFDTLVTALGAADLDDDLAGENDFTVFAPNDAAFGKLPEGLVECLLEDENKQVLIDILTYHVAEGTVTSDMLTDGMMIETLLEGKSLSVEIDEGMVKIDGTNVIEADVTANNGVIHVVESVLIPEGLDVDGFLAGCTGTSGASMSSVFVASAVSVVAGLLFSMM